MKKLFYCNFTGFDCFLKIQKKYVKKIKIQVLQGFFYSECQVDLD